MTQFMLREKEHTLLAPLLLYKLQHLCYKKQIPKIKEQMILLFLNKNQFPSKEKYNSNVQLKDWVILN